MTDPVNDRATASRGRWDGLAGVLDRAPLRAWAPGVADLPWSDPAFSERMLREHLDPTNDHASRRRPTIAVLVERLIAWLGLSAGDHLLDLTCGPGLVAHAFAERGIAVTGVDIAPAAIRHARRLTAGLPCTFIEGDTRTVELSPDTFDAAVYLYGQPAVLRPDELPGVLARIRSALRPGAPVALELRDPARVDHGASATWWTGTDDLFGAGPHLVLSERAWDAAAGATVDRQIVLSADGSDDAVYGVTERIWNLDEIRAALATAGFAAFEPHPAWDGLAFEDAGDWILVVGR